MKKFLASIAMWAFVVLIPVHVSFAMSQYGYPDYYNQGYPSYSQYEQYQLNWCNGYYSYSPCSSYYPTSYYYPQYYQYTYTPYYYPAYSYYPQGNSYSYNTNTNSNLNYNFNYNSIGGYYW